MTNAPTDEVQTEAPEWPAWKVAPAALWPVVIVAAYLGIAVLPLLLRLGR
jgi:hypothetical protein